MIGSNLMRITSKTSIFLRNFQFGSSTSTLLSKSSNCLKNKQHLNAYRLSIRRFTTEKPQDLISLLRERQQRATFRSKVDLFDQIKDKLTQNPEQLQKQQEDLTVCCNDLSVAVSLGHLNCMKSLWNQLPTQAKEQQTLFNYSISVPQSYNAVQKLLVSFIFIFYFISFFILFLFLFYFNLTQDDPEIAKNINKLSIGSGTNALHEAIIWSRFDIVRLLLEEFHKNDVKKGNNLNINIEERTKQMNLTPLLMAAQDPKDSGIFSFLIHKGADLKGCYFLL
jgi:hypothetical protein